MRIRSKRSRWWTRAAIAVSSAAALLAPAACATPSSPASSSATLSVVIQAAPNSFDPAQLGATQDSYIWASVYDTLLYADNKGELQPNAAESWSYSDGGRTLTLKLRPGMTFSSGAPVDAGAVKFTMDRTKRTAGPNQGRLAGVVSIETPDELTVVIRFAQPDGSFLNSLSANLGVIGDPPTLQKKESALDPVGSGPYILDPSGTVDGVTYSLKRRKDYWNVKAFPFETVKVRVIADRAAALNALQTGDISANTVEASQVARFQSGGFDLSFVEATALGNLVLADRSGTLLKPLGDPRVRKAINLAFDRKKMLAQVLGGAGKPSVQIFNPKGGAYDASLEQAYPHDLATARRLMDEAGYPDGFAVTMPSYAYTPTFEPAITQSLADIGITVKWQQVPPESIVASVMSKKYPMFFYIDALDVPAVMVQNHYTPASYLNIFGSTDPGLTTLLNQARAELDAAKAAELYKKINAFLVRNAWDAPLFFIGTNWVTKQGVKYLGDGSLTFSTIRAFGVSA